MNNEIKKTTPEENVGTEVESVFDISRFKAVKSKNISKSASDAGVITIVNTEAHGKRIKLSSGLLSKLGEPEKVQISFFDKNLVIASELPENDTYFNITKGGNVYAAELIVEITTEFDLDYEQRTSITFHKVRYKQIEENCIALIEIESEQIVPGA